MGAPDSRVTLHMAASLDGFIARADGRVDWMEIADHYPQGEDLSGADVGAFLSGIDCYVIGAQTYRTALAFEAKGLGWAYGDTPVYVLTHRVLRSSRPTVQFHAGDLTAFFAEVLRPKYRNIWIAGGGRLAGEAVRRGLVDEIRYSILPVLIGDGIRFFEGLDRDIRLHLVESKTYRSGVVALRHEVRRAEQHA